MDWIELDCPDRLPDAVPCRGVPWLAASDDLAFPATIPYARESLLRIQVDCRKRPAGEISREVIEQKLQASPAILFKGLPISERSHFNRFVEELGLPLHDYLGGNALRDKGQDKVSITSTELPEVVVTPHNENAYMPDPPDMIFFCCLEAAESGGEVPINDVRKTPGQLPPEFVEEMRQRDLRYIRRMRQDDSRFEVGWETSFATGDKSEIGRYLESRNINYLWKEDGSLEYWFNTPVFREYRGEHVWFNQLSECNADFWMYHPSIDEMGYTRETCQSDTAYGDGEPFTHAVRTMVRAAIWQTTELVMMEPGDVIVLDNKLVQHGRMAYRGTRRHLAALAMHPPN